MTGGGTGYPVQGGAGGVQQTDKELSQGRAEYLHTFLHPYFFLVKYQIKCFNGFLIIQLHFLCRSNFEAKE